MKNKIKKIVSFVVTDILIVTLSVFTLTNTLHTEEFVLAEDFSGDGSPQAESAEISYPYTKTFTITAYYSPLPCQEKYVTGSYDGDIRLNGHGVRGADGTPVYPGMVAAPKTFTFGTKMHIPDVGIVAVHDRGGAIVASNGNENVHDRLDIWMGYGDIGLRRALNWGKRNVEVTVYGLNDDIVEEIALMGYSPEEAIAKDCSATLASDTQTETVVIEESAPPQEVVITPSYNVFNASLSLGSTGESVLQLQKELNRLSYYKAEFTSVYDEMTVHAVFKFQQAQGIVATLDDIGAGIVGPKTRESLNAIVAARNTTVAMIAQATELAANKSGAAQVATGGPQTVSADFAFSDGF